MNLPRRYPSLPETACLVVGLQAAGLMVFEAVAGFVPRVVIPYDVSHDRGLQLYLLGLGLYLLMSVSGSIAGARRKRWGWTLCVLVQVLTVTYLGWASLQGPTPPYDITFPIRGLFAVSGFGGLVLLLLARANTSLVVSGRAAGVALALGTITLPIGAYFAATPYKLFLIPNSCDPGNALLQVAEHDPIARLQISEADVSRDFSVPRIGGTSCHGGFHERDFHAFDGLKAYKDARRQIVAAGWVDEYQQGMTLTEPDEQGRWTGYFQKGQAPPGHALNLAEMTLNLSWENGSDVTVIITAGTAKE